MKFNLHGHLVAGDFIIIGFGNGTQGVKIIGTTAKRLEIIRCQQYLSTSPFWTGAISKISRNDPRILEFWNVPARIKAEAPSDEEIAETKLAAKHRAACSKLVNKALKPIEAEHGYWNDYSRSAREAVEAEYAAKHGRNRRGNLIKS
jgi:hypothetical protein